MAPDLLMEAVLSVEGYNWIPSIHRFLKALILQYELAQPLRFSEEVLFLVSLSSEMWCAATHDLLLVISWLCNALP